MGYRDRKLGDTVLSDEQQRLRGLKA